MLRKRFSIVLVLALVVGPTMASALGFDFELLELQIVGENAFFDDFEDGILDPRIDVLHGNLPELGGSLRFTDADGTFRYSDGLIIEDSVALTPLFTNGGGGAVVTAVWAPPPMNPDYWFFAIDVTSLGTMGPFGWVALTNDDVGGAGCGTGLQVTVGFAADSPAAGCDKLDPFAITGNVVLKLILDDTRDELRWAYSIDGGRTFTSHTGFDVVPPTKKIFGFGSTAQLVVLAQAPEPATGLLLVLAALGLVRARQRR